MIDQRAHAVLYVDDDPSSLEVFRYALGDQFTIFTAGSGEKALEVLGARDIAVLLTDQRMPTMSGVELCAQALARRPETSRVIMTAYSDAQAAIDAINRGHVSRFLMKPWKAEALAALLREEIHRVAIQRAIRDTQRYLFRRGPGRVLGTLLAETLHDIGKPIPTVAAHLDAAKSALAALKQLAVGSGAPEATQRHASVAGEHVEAAKSALELMSAIQKDASARAPHKRRDDAYDAATNVTAAVQLARPQVDEAAVLQLDLGRTPQLELDAGALAEIVLNLVINAAEAIRSTQTGRGTIVVALAADSRRASLVVEDSGAGIDSAILERIFTRGFTTKEGGRGLGLAIVRSRARSCGGEVVATSRLGQGARFEVRLPLRRR